MLLEHLVLGHQVNRVRFEAARVRRAALELLEERRRRDLARLVEERLTVSSFPAVALRWDLYGGGKISTTTGTTGFLPSIPRVESKGVPRLSKTHTTKSQVVRLPPNLLALLLLRVSFARRLYESRSRAPTRRSIPSRAQTQPPRRSAFRRSVRYLPGNLLL